MERVEGGAVDPADYSAEEKNAVDEFLALLRLFLSGDMTDEELRGFIGFLRDALDDPILGPLLEAAGIDSAYLVRLGAGLDSIEDFNPLDWMSLFDALDALGGSHEFAILDPVRVDFADWALERLAIALQEETDLTARSNSAANASLLIEALIESGVAVTLSPEIIQYLVDSGMTSEDTSNEKLKIILDADDPVAAAEGITFTAEELTEIDGEIVTYSDNIITGLSTDTLLDVQEMLNFISELELLLSAIRKAMHDTQNVMITNIGAM